MNVRAHHLDLFDRPQKSPLALEFPVHCMIADLLRVSIAPGWLWMHYPAGEHRNKSTAGRLKRMGVKRGVADFLLVAPKGGRLHALELKREGKRPTREQFDFLEAVIDAGGRATWVDCFDDAVTVLRDWRAVRVSI